MGRPRIYEKSDRYIKVECGCGQIYTKTNKSHHIKTKIHMLFERMSLQYEESKMTAIPELQQLNLYVNPSK